jgi:GNAT superfamily N-acetyltransferase
MISLATTDPERVRVQKLFSEVFGDKIEPNAVPMTAVDHMYTPLVAQAIDEEGELVGAALTCAPQVVAGLALMPQLASPNLLAAGQRVSELDLMAVAPHSRGKGLGAAMLSYLEPLLFERGVRAWFGCVTDGDEATFLRSFYSRLGFNVLPDRRPLPPFAGQDWSTPTAHPPVFSFWKRPATT